MNKFKKVRKTFENLSIRRSTFIYFTVTAIVATLIIGIALYIRLSDLLTQTIKEENIGLVSQVNSSIESYVRNVIRLSDSLYYGVIKNVDLKEEDVGDEFKLLYDNNKSDVEDIALLSKGGELLEVIPAARVRTDYNLKIEKWFTDTLEVPEKIHFFQPQVQYLFDSADNQYKWVIMLTRSVEITRGGKAEQAVLLIDLKYSGLEDIIDNVKLGNGGYIYLIDSKGDIIWHPKMSLINSKNYTENNMVAVGYTDGTFEEIYNHESRTITVKTVGYTGWKIIGVTPTIGLSLDSIKTRLFLVFILFLILFLVLVVNSYLSVMITDPIHKLEKSVNELDGGNLDADIYIGGSYEIQHLGNSVNALRFRIKKLMRDLEEEHKLKLEKELEVLQEQINPHFLYNTLESIVWMIEDKKANIAVDMITVLGQFFRIGLNSGESDISVADEIKHVSSYLRIQTMRNKYQFKYEFNIAEGTEIDKLLCLKIILQPIVENAIGHAMEYMGEEGMIQIDCQRDGKDLYFRVKDNGPGMTEEIRQSLLSTDTKKVKSKKGSGIALKNVNERIKLRFGKQYGLDIHSELDEGTEVIIHLPAEPYDKQKIYK